MAILKILVVDDEPGIRSGILRILKNFKTDFPFMEEPIEYDLLEASSGEEALEIIDEKRPDIVLLDNKLPGMQGIEVLEWINKNRINALVAMITSYASLDMAVKATRDGAFDFIPKPFTPQELRSSIENLSKQVYLRKLSKKLKKEGRQIRFQFLSVLSHELKNPLHAIEGYLRMMKERQSGEDMKEYDEMINRSLERVDGMRNLILDMLDLTRLESGISLQNTELLTLNEIATQAVDSIRPYAIQKNVATKIIADAIVNYTANRDDMEIIFNNLISNAVKYNVDGGRMACNISEDDEKITIIVSDTGIGMSEEDIPKIFQEFYRIKNHQTKAVAGSGLGLTILSNTLKLYNGEINVRSSPGNGSTFTVILPKKKIE